MYAKHPRLAQHLAVMLSLPDEVLDDCALRHEAALVLWFCADMIEGGLDWPDAGMIGHLRRLYQGYGCWLGEIEAAITEAGMPARERDLWLTAFRGAKALVAAFHRGPPPVTIEPQVDALLGQIAWAVGTDRDGLANQILREGLSAMGARCSTCAGAGVNRLAGVAVDLTCQRCHGSGLDPDAVHAVYRATSEQAPDDDVPL